MTGNPDSTRRHLLRTVSAGACVAVAMQDVAGGQVDLMFGALPTLRPYIDGGKLRALAVTTSDRAKTLDDVPTLAEAGVPGIDVPSWYGVMAPAAVSEALVDRIQQTVAGILERPAVQERLGAQGLGIEASAARDFGEQIRKETAQWAEVIREGGIRAEE